MEKRISPVSGKEMLRIEDPDISYDLCEESGSIFLDPGELNDLVTGMTGDIESLSVDDDEHKDDHPIRNSPVDPSVKMKKVNLLRYSDIIIDYCPVSRGFFLDKSELQKINQELASFTATNRPDELREEIDGRLVRVEYSTGSQIVPVLGSVTPVGTSVSATAVFRIIVFYKTPADITFHAYSEKFLTKISKLLGLFKGQDIQVGHSSFDSKFILESDDPDQSKKIFTPAVCDTIVDFISLKPKIFSEFGKLEIHDSFLVYWEGPYLLDHSAELAVSRSKDTISELGKIAATIENELEDH
ncbi:MAG: zf-TFIIB domain-containing protein [Verrucomicrobiota bacterium]